MANTRFAPTLNGLLHIGHLFTLLVNEHVAHSTGGKFYIRMEDADYLVDLQPKKKTEAIRKAMIKDIGWLELDVDGWQNQSDVLAETRRFISNPKHQGFAVEEKLKTIDYVIPLVIRMGTGWSAIPYVPQQTIERVYMDHLLDITHVIRGDDFITEYSLYAYFCEQFGFPIPEMVFLPRLSSTTGDISKTNGGYKIRDFRNEGYSAKKLKEMVIRSCIIYPKNGLELYNIKSNPKINL